MVDQATNPDKIERFLKRPLAGPSLQTEIISQDSCCVLPIRIFLVKNKDIWMSRRFLGKFRRQVQS